MWGRRPGVRSRRQRRARAVAVSTSTPLPRTWTRAVAKDAAAPAAYALGALLLAGEAAVHVQQYVAEFRDVRWIGPLFLANAVAIVVTIAGLTLPRTRP